MPNTINVTPENIIFFAEIRKVHYDNAVNELSTRQANCSKTKINNKGKAVKVGIKDLIKVLKLSMRPNVEAESKSMSKDEQNVFKHFKPSYLTTEEWCSLSTNPSNPSSTSTHLFAFYFSHVVLHACIFFRRALMYVSM